MEPLRPLPIRATVALVIAKDLSKAVSVEFDDILRFFVAQIVLDKTKPVKDRMPEMNEYLKQIREAIKPIVTESQSSSGTQGWGSARYMPLQLRNLKKIKTEAEGYKPWVNLTNTALLLLKDKKVAGLRERNITDDIIMQRTDPSHLDYYHNSTMAVRKPDIAFFKLKRAQALHGTRENWDTIAKNCAPSKPLSKDKQKKQEHIDQGPEDAGLPYFDWSDILFFSEHKLTNGHHPQSLSFEDLLILEKLRKPVSPSPSSPKPTQSYNQSTSSNSLHTKSNVKAGKRGIDEVSESSSGGRRSKSQKTSAGSTASSGFRDSQHISLSQTIAKDAVFVPTVGPKLFAVQAGEYGLGRLNSWFGMTHSLGCLVLDSLLYICWFDREGLIGSSAIDVSKDLEKYLMLLFVLQRFEDNEWGRLAALDDSTIRIMDETWKVDTEDVLHKPWGIIGRNTTVIGCSRQSPTSQPNASAPSIPTSDVSPIYGMPSVDYLPKRGDGTPAQNDELLIYDQTHPTSHVAAEDSIPGPSSADESQTKEQTKKDEEEGHAGRMKKNSFVLKFSWVEETRVQEHKVYEKIKDIAQTDSDVEGHVPDLVAHHAFDNTCTSIIRDALGVVTGRSRLLIANVFKRLDGTIRDLSGADYWDVYWETFLCHYGLWTQGVHHRDISDGNLMFKKDKDTGKVIGVLGDFDLSSLEDNKVSNTERTGTVPFMALDLLSTKALAGNVVHDYCHEAEAYFWVGVYDTACYDSGRTVHSAVPAQWNSLGAEAMRIQKRDYLSNLSTPAGHIPTSSQKDVWKGLSLLRIPLKERQIFERPTESNLSLYEFTPQLWDASLHEPNAVRKRCLELKDLAESYFPSLSRTSTSS